MTVTDSTGKQDQLALSETGFTVAGGAEQVVEQKMTVHMPSLWSPENPHLYILRSEIVVDGRATDAVSGNFGIRSIRYDADSGFLLNGRRVKMNGVCLHQDAGCVGSAVPDAIWASRLRLLKEMGCNAIRTSHNPESPALLDLCDRMQGSLVMGRAILMNGRFREGEHTDHSYLFRGMGAERSDGLCPQGPQSSIGGAMECGQ